MRDPLPPLPVSPASQQVVEGVGRLLLRVLLGVGLEAKAGIGDDVKRLKQTKHAFVSPISFLNPFSPERQFSLCNCPTSQPVGIWGLQIFSEGAFFFITRNF